MGGQTSKWDIVPYLPLRPLMEVALGGKECGENWLMLVQLIALTNVVWQWGRLLVFVVLTHHTHSLSLSLSLSLSSPRHIPHRLPSCPVWTSTLTAPTRSCWMRPSPSSVLHATASELLLHTHTHTHTPQEPEHSRSYSYSSPYRFLV